MKAKKDFIIVVKRKGVITYLSYKFIKGKGVKMTWSNRYEALKDNATVFNSYGKALSILLYLDSNKDQGDIIADESYDIIERSNIIER
jgi:hypothetical protein